MYFNKFDRDKRKFIKNSLTTILFSNIFAFKICAKEKSSYLLSGPLSGKIYYTKNNPGRWKDILESHVPEASINNNILEVSTLHEMRGYEHYISKHIVLDHKLNIISEKIFDCFYSGTIPIYLGDPNISDTIPSDTFIDYRDFSNINDLLKYLDDMPKKVVKQYKDKLVSNKIHEKIFPISDK